MKFKVITRLGMLVAAVAIAGAVTSVMIVFAASRPKPPCSRLDDSSCHPSGPVVTNAATQTITGNVNVTGTLCVGTGTSQQCMPSSGEGSTGAGNLTMFKTPIDFSDSIRNLRRVKVNARTIIQQNTGIDPGPVKAVLIHAAIDGRLDCQYGYYVNYAPSFWVAHGDIDLTTEPEKRYLVMGSCYTGRACNGSYCYDRYLTEKSDATHIVATNSSSEFSALYSSVGTAGIEDSRYDGISPLPAGSSGQVRFHLLGFYK